MHMCVKFSHGCQIQKVDKIKKHAPQPDKLTISLIFVELLKKPIIYATGRSF